MKFEVITMFILLLILVPITIIDIQTMRIPNKYTYSGIFLFLIIRVFGYEQSILYSSLLLLTGFIPFVLIWFITQGKLGLGDAKLSALLALSLGFYGWFIMLFVSSFTALIFAVSMLMTKKIKKDSKIPYGPFLSFGAIIAIYFI